MQKVVGVSVSHKIRLSLVTDDWFNEDGEKCAGLRAFDVELDGNYVEIVGMDGADWLQLLGCEVEFGCLPLTRSEASLFGYDPDDEIPQLIINRVLVTKKPNEKTTENDRQF